MIPLAYKDTDFQFQHLSILLPLLTVVSYDPKTGRLILNLSEVPQALNKLQMFQDMLLTAIASQYLAWFPAQQKRPQDIRAGFQPMIQNGELHLYCPGSEGGGGEQRVSMYQDGAWKQARLKAGDRVRIAFRLYGISFHISPVSGTWSGKFRLQHKLVGILAIPR